MSEFKKLEGEFSDIEAQISKEMMPKDVELLQERLKTAGDSLAKYISRRSEVDHVTDKTFLGTLNGSISKLENISESIAKLKDEALARQSQSGTGATDMNQESQTLEQLLALPIEQERLARIEVEELEAKKEQFIVQVPRYGPSMIQRIDKLEALKVSILSQMPQAIEAARFLAEKAALVAQEAEERAKLLDLEIRKQNKLEEAVVRAQREAEDKAIAEEEANLQRLKDEKQKAEKDALEVRVAAEIYSRGWPSGEQGVREGVQLLRNRASESELKVALGGLCAILQGLIKYPDDEKRRTIKVLNEKFHLDIGRFGCEVLFAAGFKLKHIRCEGEVGDDGLNKYEAILFLREPDPFANIDQWTIWFDNLKLCSEVVSTLASEVGATMMKPQGSAPGWAQSGKGY